MANLHNIKRIIFLYVFWFFVIAFIWVIGEYFLFGRPFYTSVYLLNTYTPTAFVYAAFLAVAFALFQYILSPKPISSSAISTQPPISTMQQETKETMKEVLPTEFVEEKKVEKLTFKSKKKAKKIKSKKKVKK